MSTAALNNSDLFDSLKNEYEAATSNLKDIDENIKKITGRDPAESRQNVRRMAAAQAGGSDFRNRDRSSQAYGPNIQNNDYSPRGKRGMGSNRLGGRGRNPRFSRQHNDESPDEDEPPRKVTVQSSVVATPREVKSRRDTIETQKGDKKVVERNRRMFGMILGTLQKFQSEESKRKDQSNKRAEIEQKLEEAANKEKEEMRKERQGLFMTRREKQAQMRRIEQKLEIVQLHDEWEKSQRFLLNFIMSKCAPSVAFKPKKSCPESEKRLKESQERILENIRVQKEAILTQLAEIDELYHKGGGDEEEEGMETTVTVKDKENLGPAPGEPTATAEVADRVEGSTDPPNADEAMDTSTNEVTNINEMGKLVKEIEGGDGTLLPPADESSPPEAVKNEGQDAIAQAVDSAVSETKLDNVDSVKDDIESLAVIKIPDTDKPLETPIGDQEFEPIYD